MRAFLDMKPRANLTVPLLLSTIFRPHPTVQSELQPSNVYYSWEPTSPLAGPDKLLQEIMREAATESGFDETTISKLLNHVNPVVEPEQAKQLQNAYTDHLVRDLASTVKADPNYSADKYPKLASKMKSLGV